MAPTSRFATPIAPEITVREARDLYLRENGFSLAMYSEPTFVVPVGPLSVRLPNPPERKRVVGAHDLHHVLCGYGTDWIGEIEVSVWEVRAGLGRSWIAWTFCLPAALMGLVVCPRRAYRAWRAAEGAHSLLGPNADREALLDLPVGEARRRQGVPTHGAADHPARLNRRAPGV